MEVPNREEIFIVDFTTKSYSLQKVLLVEKIKYIKTLQEKNTIIYNFLQKFYKVKLFIN